MRDHHAQVRRADLAASKEVVRRRMEDDARDGEQRRRDEGRTARVVSVHGESVGSGWDAVPPRLRTWSPPMSGNAKQVDLRVRRTLHALAGALLGLVQARPFASILVQDVLDRAGVSRTTFYAHFAGMDDLLTTSVDAFFARAATLVDRHPDADDRVVAVRELFAHVAEARPLADALRASGHGPELLAMGRAHFARAIARRLERRGLVGPQGTASALAGALFSLLEWWLDARPAGSPADVDALFHRLVPFRRPA